MRLEAVVPPPCSIIAVTGGRGGVGKSTVASGLAMCLNAKCPGKVVLMDMYTRFGDIAAMLNLENVKSFAGLEGYPGVIDLELLESYMSEHKSGLRVMSASKEVTDNVLGADLLESILHVLKTEYRYVVIDLPPLIHEPVLRVISLCHRLLIVANRIEVHTVTDGKKLLDIVAPEYIPREQVWLVVNRVSSHDSIPQRQLEQALGMKAIALLPYERGQDGRLPAPNSKLWRALYRLAEKLMEPPESDGNTYYMNVTRRNKRVLIAAKDRESRDHISQILTSAGSYDVVGVAVDGLEAVHMAKTRKPDVAVVMVDLPVYDGLETTELIVEYAPSVKVILIVNGHVDDELRERAMLAGARACLSSAEVDSNLLSKIRKITEGYIIKEVPPCSIIAVTGGRGGIGKSTVAAGLAMCLNAKCPGKVVLLDMYTMFGDICTMLGLENVKSVADLAGYHGVVNLKLLEPFMSEHKTGLKVMVAFKEVRDWPGDDRLESILHVLKTEYRYVVIDLPPVMHEPVLRVISLCHKLLIVANRIEVHAVTDGKKLLDSLAPKYIPLEQVGLVVNRESKTDTISLLQVEQTLGIKAVALLPNERGLDGKLPDPSSKLGKAIERLAEKLMEPPESHGNLGNR